jgi:hypothetical protein
MSTRRRPQAFAALAMGLIAAASTISASFAKGDMSESALRSLELRRFEAQVNADAGVLDGLLDDDLEYVHSNGELDTKQSFIDSLTSGRRDYASTAATLESVRMYKGFAIIRGKARVTVIDAGTSRDLHIGFTDVWVEKNGQWRMTSWRSARLPDSPVK